MTRLTLITVLGLLIMSCPALAQAPGGAIGVYADIAGTSTTITAPLYVPTTFYILGMPNVENLYGGLAGAEFRVKGAPPQGMIITSTPSPASTIALNDPFSDETLPAGTRGGCNIAFPECQAPDENGFVLLYTVVATDIASTTNIILEVDRRDPPSNPYLAPFPLFNACNPDTFTAVQVEGLTATINAVSISVESQEWGAVKSLYR
jgi:hypothetical protein